VTAPGSILILDTNGNSRVLVSSRRVPPQNSLDPSAEHISSPVFSGPGQTLCVIVGASLWSASASGNDWTQLSTWSVQGETQLFENGFLIKPPSLKLSGTGMWYGLAQNQTNVEELLYQELPNRSFFQLDTKPKYQSPQRVKLNNTLLCLDTNTVWVFAGNLKGHEDPAGRPVLDSINNREGLLLKVSENPSNAPVLALHLELPATSTVTPLLLPKKWGNFQVSAEDKPLNGMGQKWLGSLPPGLILTKYRLPGFWLIPRAELERCLQKDQSSSTTAPPAAKPASP